MGERELDFDFATYTPPLQLTSYYLLAPARIYFKYRFVGMKYFKKSNIMSSSSTL